MRAVLGLLGRFVSGRGKSPLRNATELAFVFAAISLIFYSSRGEPFWRLALGALILAALGFALGFGFTIYNDRRHPGR